METREYALLVFSYLYLISVTAAAKGDLKLPDVTKARLRGVAEFKCTYSGDVTLFYVNKEDPKNPSTFTDHLLTFFPGTEKTEIQTDVPDLKKRLGVTYSDVGGEKIFTVSIEAVRCSDGGKYQCEVLHAKSVSDVTELRVEAPPLQPKITPIAIEQELDTQLTLTCEGNVGVPYGALTWYRKKFAFSPERLTPSNASTEPSNSDCRGYGRSQIKIVATRDMHNAVYTCYASKPGIPPTNSGLKVEYQLVIKGMSATTTPRSADTRGTGKGTSHHLSTLLSVMLWLMWCNVVLR